MSSNNGESDKTIVSRERAERRRVLARTIRDQRERLMSGSGTRPAFDYELMLSLARNRAGAVYAILLLGGLVAATALLWIETTAIAAWLVVVLVVNALSLFAYRRFSALPHGKADLHEWLRRFIVLESAHGLAWATLIVMSWSVPQSSGIDVFQFSITIIVISVGTILASNVPGAAIAGTAPIVLSAIVVFGSRGELLYYAM
ncbi:MAG: hypothetical protein ACTSWI_05790, partial [Alphaproteobacteria bacterium]